MNEVNQQTQPQSPNGNINEESIKESSKSTWKRYFLFGIIAGLLSLIIVFIIVLLPLLGFRVIKPSQTQTPPPELTTSFPKIEADYFETHIGSPEEGAQVLQGDPIHFRGDYFRKGNSKNEIFWKERMTWESSMGGVFGKGDELTFRYLGPGVHTITFTVEDDKGNKSTDSRKITIRQDPSLTSQGADQFLNDCLKQGESSNCLNTLISKLAVWNKEKALEIINNHPENRTLKWNFETELYEFAKATNKDEICSELTDKEFREGCFVSVAVDTKSPSLCENAGTRAGNCYFWVASKMRDPKLCEKSENVNSCLENVEKNKDEDPFYY